MDQATQQELVKIIAGLLVVLVTWGLKKISIYPWMNDASSTLNKFVHSLGVAVLAGLGAAAVNGDYHTFVTAFLAALGISQSLYNAITALVSIWVKKPVALAGG